jgi:uncharacterized Zn finger protein (UPF0148 family)
MVKNDTLLKQEDLEFIEIDDRIKSLSVDQINDLITRYYNGEKLKSLRQDFDIPGNYSKLVSTLPPLILEEKCPNCGISLVKQREERDRFGLHGKTHPYCKECNHRTDWTCYCPSCTEKREAEIAKKQEKESQQEFEKFQIEKRKRESYENKQKGLYDGEKYSLPINLTQYFSKSKLIQEKLSEDMLSEIEDQYIQFKTFYDFSDDDFSMIVISAVKHFQKQGSFSRYLNKSLKEGLSLSNSPLEDSELKGIYKQHIKETKRVIKDSLSKELSKKEMNFKNVQSYYLFIGEYLGFSQAIYYLDPPSGVSTKEHLKMLKQTLNSDFHFQTSNKLFTERYSIKREQNVVEPLESPDVDLETDSNESE